MKQAFRKIASAFTFRWRPIQHPESTLVSHAEPDAVVPPAETRDTDITATPIETVVGSPAQLVKPWSAQDGIEEGSRSVLSARKSRNSGPEHRLVQGFLERYHFNVPEGFRMTLFREPRIESGFPDLVCVIWKTQTAEAWHPKRAALKKPDLQLLQILATVNSYQPIPDDFFQQKRYARSLHRLAEAEVIRRVDQTWVIRSLTSLFAVTDIIAIEAKMRDWTEVVNQAQINTWFASRSYILVPRIPAGSFLPEYAANAGVGLLTGTDPEFPVVEATRHPLPRSYASWMFNEWVCASAQFEG